MDTKHSIEELEGVWEEPDADAPRLVRRCYSLRRKPIGQLSIEDMRLLLSQGVGSAVVLPLAVEVLERDLLAEGDLYPGDLLQSVLSIDSTEWRAHGLLKERLMKVLRARRDGVETSHISKDIREDLKDSINRFLAD
jgi:hypothetical protein